MWQKAINEYFSKNINKGNIIMYFFGEAFTKQSILSLNVMDTKRTELMYKIHSVLIKWTT